MWYIYTVEYYSTIKKMKQCICSNMNGPRDYNTKESKSDRETQIPYDITYMWNLKQDTKKCMGIRICTIASLCYTLETNTILQINYTSIKKLINK